MGLFSRNDPDRDNPYAPKTTAKINERNNNYDSQILDEFGLFGNHPAHDTKPKKDEPKDDIISRVWGDEYAGRDAAKQAEADALQAEREKRQAELDAVEAERAAVKAEREKYTQDRKDKEKNRASEEQKKKDIQDLFKSSHVDHLAGEKDNSHADHLAGEKDTSHANHLEDEKVGTGNYYQNKNSSSSSNMAGAAGAGAYYQNKSATGGTNSYNYGRSSSTSGNRPYGSGSDTFARGGRPYGSSGGSFGSGSSFGGSRGFGPDGPSYSKHFNGNDFSNMKNLSKKTSGVISALIIICFMLAFLYSSLSSSGSSSSRSRRSTSNSYNSSGDNSQNSRYYDRDDFKDDGNGNSYVDSDESYEDETTEAVDESDDLTQEDTEEEYTYTSNEPDVLPDQKFNCVDFFYTNEHNYVRSGQEITNHSDKTVNVIAGATLYNTNGEMIDTDVEYAYALGPGETIFIKDYFRDMDTNGTASYVEHENIYKINFEQESYAKNLSYTSNPNGLEVTVDVTNNGSEDARSLAVRVVFFDRSGNMIDSDVQSNYNNTTDDDGNVVINDGRLVPGSSLSFTCKSHYQFDHYSVYVSSYARKQ